MIVLSHFISYVLEHNNIFVCNLIKKETTSQTPKYLKLVQPNEILIMHLNTKWSLSLAWIGTRRINKLTNFGLQFFFQKNEHLEHANFFFFFTMAICMTWSFFFMFAPIFSTNETSPCGTNIYGPEASHNYFIRCEARKKLDFGHMGWDSLAQIWPWPLISPNISNLDSKLKIPLFVWANEFLFRIMEPLNLDRIQHTHNSSILNLTCTT